ncbi:hypothetical protein C4K68_10045 [Pokkaliibacter plantistimulans]|uniref:Peptidase C58 YopT-type domain-containing protein n=1 Tax=Proteobacteria bacterium 228 TaxID=2083153 RepID=A0A2S5KS40_9PROT|nr:YopT-type cysteine protease domain-containing protein [Pokkaliibacter plantistimulans]PPC77533.1 hypothetical protein C4K68_10045 [Pokkaliibacter plantistimulans]
MTTAINHLSPVQTGSGVATRQDVGVNLQAGKAGRFEHFQPRTHQTFAGGNAAAGSSTLPSPPEQALSQASSSSSSWLSRIGARVASVAKQVASSTAESLDPSLAAERHLQATAELATKHGCQLSHPFHQSSYLSDKLWAHDFEFSKSLGLHESRLDKENLSYACLGLSATWVQSQIMGQPSETYFKRLDNHRQDPTMKNVLLIQHREQQKYPGITKDARPMLKELLPKLGLKPGSNGDGRLLHNFMHLSELDVIRDHALLPGHKQSFLLLTPYHAIGLHQHASGKVEYFDPEYGVVKADNKQQLFAFLKDVTQRDMSTLFGPSLFGMRPTGFQLAEVEPQARSAPVPSSSRAN